MTTNNEIHPIKTPRWLLTVAVVLSYLFLGTAWAADGFVFVHNAANPIHSLNKDAAKKAFTGQTKEWANGTMVQIVLPKKGSPEMKWLAESVFGISEDLLLSKIKQETFKGELRKPVVADSASECVEQIKGNAGAIGVVSADAAKTLPSGVAAASSDIK